MEHIICCYDSENERVTIRADDAVIGELKEIKVDNVAFVVQSLIRMYQQVNNNKKNKLWVIILFQKHQLKYLTIQTEIL